MTSSSAHVTASPMPPRRARSKPPAKGRPRWSFTGPSERARRICSRRSTWACGDTFPTGESPLLPPRNSRIASCKPYRTGQSVPFRKQFRDCDALLLDDLHFLGGKRKTQEEFLHTFDVLGAAGKPVIVTSDCHPRLTDDFVPELADRLVGGAVWGIQPPDDTTRLDLLRAKSAKTHTAVNEEVLTFLARQRAATCGSLRGAEHPAAL